MSITGIIVRLHLKYRRMFLNETTKETQAKIKAGIYKLANLN